MWFYFEGTTALILLKSEISAAVADNRKGSLKDAMAADSKQRIYSDILKNYQEVWKLPYFTLTH